MKRTKRTYVITSCVLLLLVIPASGDKAPLILEKVVQNQDFFSEPWVLHEYEDYMLYDVKRLDDGRIGVVFLAPSGMEYRCVYDVETLSAVYMDVAVRKKAQREAMLRESVRVADAIKIAKSCAARTSGTLHLNYSIRGKDSLAWKPIRVWDDGVKTYLQLKKGTTKAAKKGSEHPALTVYEGKEKKGVMTEYRVKTDMYVADRLFLRAELSIGEKSRERVVITRLSGK